MPEPHPLCVEAARQIDPACITSAPDAPPRYVERQLAALNSLILEDAALIDRTCRVSEREALLAECRDVLEDAIAIMDASGVRAVYGGQTPGLTRAKGLLARLDTRPSAT